MKKNNYVVEERNFTEAPLSTEEILNITKRILEIEVRVKELKGDKALDVMEAFGLLDESSHYEQILLSSLSGELTKAHSEQNPVQVMQKSSQIMKGKKSNDPSYH